MADIQSTTGNGGAASEAVPPLLSICVPTYNRARQLRECMLSIAAAVARLDAQQRCRVEILVSDNASSDDTQGTIASLRECGLDLVAWRNQHNCGAEGNFRVLLSRSRGRFVWLFGDDDRMGVDALVALWPAMVPEVGLLHLNYRVLLPDRVTVFREGNRGLAADGARLDCEAALLRFGPLVSYCTGNVFQKAVFEAAEANTYDRLASRGFSFLYAMYSGLRQTALHAAAIAAPLFECCADPAPAYDWYEYFVDGTNQAMRALRAEGYSRRAIRAARSRVIYVYLLPRMSLDAAAGRLPRREVFQRTMRHYGDLRAYWWALMPVILAPAWAVRALRAGYAAWRHRRP